MTLFKNKIIDYEIMKYDEEDYLILHCSREDFVKAPFDGEITKDGELYILNIADYKLYIKHMTWLGFDNKIEAGQLIGKPMVGNEYGYDTAYIGIKLYKDIEMLDIVKYLKFQDDTYIPKEKQTIEENYTKEVQKKTSAKKKTTKKKK